MASDDTTKQHDDDHKLIAQRRTKLQALRDNGNAFPNDFRRDVMAGELLAEYGEHEAEALEAEPRRVAVAGRMMGKRVMGKASFAHVMDMSGRIQLFVQRDALPEGVYPAYSFLSLQSWGVSTPRIAL